MAFIKDGFEFKFVETIGLGRIGDPTAEKRMNIRALIRRVTEESWTTLPQQFRTQDQAKTGVDEWIEAQSKP